MKRVKHPVVGPVAQPISHSDNSVTIINPQTGRTLLGSGNCFMRTFDPKTKKFSDWEELSVSGVGVVIHDEDDKP